MPKRPSRSKRVNPNAKAATPGIQGGATPGEKNSKERRDDLTTKALLSKFQGRKSV